jgi:tetratricopeptide (TPR) repeat protein
MWLLLGAKAGAALEGFSGFGYRENASLPLWLFSAPGVEAQMSPSIDLEKPVEDAPGETRAQYPCLLVEASPQADELGLQFILISEQVSLGRGPGCTVSLKDPAISARHTALNISPGPSGKGPQVTVSHLSPQGETTRIGDEPLGPNAARGLRLGEVLGLGNTRLRYGLAGLEPRLAQVQETVAGLMRQARYDEALGALATLEKYRPVGGSRRTPLERRLLSAQLLEARIHSVLGRWSKAIDLLEELIGPDTPDEELRLKALFQLGVLSVQRNDLERALTLVDRMWELAEGRDGYFLALALCLRGMTAARLRDFALARRAFRDASAKLRLSGRSTRNLSARILLELGISHFLAEQHELALELFARLKQEEGQGEPHRVSCAEALRYSAVIHSLRRDFEKADALLCEALKTFQEARWRFMECKARKSRALNSLSWGRIEEATVHLRLCQELLTHEVENEYERAVCAGQLGKVYLTRGDAQEALRWFEQERQLQSGLPGVAHSQAYTHRNFARAHRNLGNAGQAELCYVRAVETFHEFSNWVQKGLTLVELCRHRIDMGEVEQAAAALGDAEHSFQAAGRGQGFEPTLNVLRAQLAWARGEGARAQALYATSLQSLEASRPSYLLAEGLSWLLEQFRKEREG